MLPENNLSLKYANALLCLAEAADKVSIVETDLRQLAKAIHDNAEILRFIADTLVSSEGKNAALSEMFSGHVSPILMLFLQILQIEGHLALIGSISKNFTELIAARRNQVSGEIVSSFPLAADKIQEIERETSRILNKDVSLSPSVDAGMLGGFLIRVGDFVIDGTLETELSRARNAIAG